MKITVLRNITPTKLHNATFHKTVIFITTAVRTSYPQNVSTTESCSFWWRCVVLHWTEFRGSRRAQANKTAARGRTISGISHLKSFSFFYVKLRLISLHHLLSCPLTGSNPNMQCKNTKLFEELWHMTVFVTLAEKFLLLWQISEKVDQVLHGWGEEKFLVPWGGT
jgi:hypothetical protein